MNKNYQLTMDACFLGYIVQAIVNNFVPLLFLTFQGTFGIPLEQITFLVTINFLVQLLVDFLAIFVVDKIGYRVAMIIAHACAVVGFLGLTVLPNILTPFVGLLISVIIYAIGGGLLEVLVSPIVEACPTDNKEKAMSLLHSFYCFGHVLVVLISTLFFTLIGIQEWRILAVMWGIIPLLNLILFTKVPIPSVIADGVEEIPAKKLLSHPIFFILIVMMICAGASEQAVSQWASTLAEQGLGITKTLGDLAGPLGFALCMGLSRAIYGKYGDKINLRVFMTMSTILCIVAYLLIGLSQIPAFGLIGCAICGLSVGIMWPGTFSQAAGSLKGGGTAMYALLALAGDLGCSSGPTLVGIVSSQSNDNLQLGILTAIIFPVILLVCIYLIRNKKVQYIS